MAGDEEGEEDKGVGGTVSTEEQDLALLEFFSLMVSHCTENRRGPREYEMRGETHPSEGAGGETIKARVPLKDGRQLQRMESSHSLWSKDGVKSRKGEVPSRKGGREAAGHSPLSYISHTIQWLFETLLAKPPPVPFSPFPRGSLPT